MSGGGDLRTHRSRLMLAARALLVRPSCELSSAQIGKARRMARDGATTEEIAQAIGFLGGTRWLGKRLRRLNIKPFNPTNKMHRGYDVLVNGQRIVDTRPFKPQADQ